MFKAKLIYRLGASFSQIIYKVGAKIFSGHGIGKLYPIKAANNIMSYMVSRLKLNTVEVLGHKMFLHPKDFFSSIKAYALEELEFAKKVIKKVMLFWLLGHISDTTH